MRSRVVVGALSVVALALPATTAAQSGEHEPVDIAAPSREAGATTARIVAPTSALYATVSACAASAP